MTLKNISFLLPVTYPDRQIEQGLDDALEVFRYAESLGFDGGWVRQRHLENNLSSAIVFLSAATQHTSRIDLGVAVLPLAYENPFRLAEHLLTLDALSRGRLQSGVSVGLPMYFSVISHATLGEGYDPAAAVSFTQIIDLVGFLRGELSPNPGVEIPSGVLTPLRVQPEQATTADRVWYGGTSRESARRAAEQGLHFTTAIVTKAEEGEDFTQAQLRLAQEFLGNRTSSTQRFQLGRTVLPFDNADADSRARYRSHGEFRQKRAAGQKRPSGPTRAVQAPDLIGTAEQILEQISADPIAQLVEDIRIEIPYHYEVDDTKQILHDFAVLIAPELGWTPPA